MPSLKIQAPSMCLTERTVTSGDSTTSNDANSTTIRVKL